jgi:hypothetical protein
VLAANRSLAWLLVAFGAVTIAEWGYVTALAIDAFRLRGGIAGFRLFFAAASSFLCVPFVERHPGGRMLTAIAGIRAGSRRAAVRDLLPIEEPLCELDRPDRNNRIAPAV